MSHLSDIEIANQVEMKPIKEVVKPLGIEEVQLTL
jgi:formate--tetrahydrofolate ligase